MYAGDQERQISALAQSNQALANEEYNRKMQALQQAQYYKKYGDERVGQAEKDMNRSGLLGMGANFIDALRGDKGTPSLTATNTFAGQLPDKQNVQVDTLGPQGLQTMSPEQAKVDAYNIEKQRKQDLKSEKEYQSKIKANPTLRFLDYAKNKGIEIPAEYKGSKADQRKQNYDLHNAQVEFFKSIGDRKSARKAESEWIQNEINIDKSWGDSGTGNYKSQWDTSAPRGKYSGKTKDITFIPQWIMEDGTLNTTDQTETGATVPIEVAVKGDKAIVEWFNDNRPSGAMKIAGLRNTTGAKEYGQGDEKAGQASTRATEYANNVIAGSSTKKYSLVDGVMYKSTKGGEYRPIAKEEADRLLADKAITQEQYKVAGF